MNYSQPAVLWTTLALRTLSELVEVSADMLQYMSFTMDRV